MAFSYDKLWKLLIDKKMTKENFRILIKASPTTIAAMGKGEGISPKVLDRICTAFNCQPGDIMEHVPNTSSERGEIFQMTEYDFIKTVTVRIIFMHFNQAMYIQALRLKLCISVEYSLMN